MKDDDRFYLSVFGIEFLSQNTVLLPDGWCLQEEETRKVLRDSRGHVRAEILSFDTSIGVSTYLRVLRRYMATWKHVRVGTQSAIESIVVDSDGNVLYRGGDIYLQKGQSLVAIIDYAVFVGRQWLSTHFPHFEDPLAYWD